MTANTRPEPSKSVWQVDRPAPQIGCVATPTGKRRYISKPDTSSSVWRWHPEQETGRQAQRSSYLFSAAWFFERMRFTTVLLLLALAVSYMLDSSGSFLPGLYYYWMFYTGWHALEYMWHNRKAGTGCA